MATMAMNPASLLNRASRKELNFYNGPSLLRQANAGPYRGAYPSLTIAMCTIWGNILTWQYYAFVAVEETLEMLGVVIFLYALMLYCGMQQFNFGFRDRAG